ncbi:TIGR03854 family LLM class F420-dependent oxidoreductase [Streptosporangium sp. G11]|uniref:TIGR03854 family LLM class F420-dependent oxidoreductase n=1 Tax=Streptosporangium sp. G11 TaxID=3436926 RepID=UPI003EB76B8A
MKVRIGVGHVPVGAHDPAAGLAELADELEAHRVDSVWLSDLASAPHTVDPLIGLAYIAGRTRRLKLGTGVLILPGRDPAVVAMQLAGLAALAPGRVLPTFGIRPAQPADRPAYAVPPGRHAEVFEEALTVVRALLSRPNVTHHGEFFHLDEVSIAPLPAKPLDLWLSGRLPAALDRVGRLADGWLGSNITSGEAEACRVRIERAAADAGREIEPDHYGTYLTVVLDDADERAVGALLDGIRRRRPDGADPRTLVCRGWAAAREEMRRFVDAGLTKFVVRPAAPVTSRRDFLDQFVAELGPMET